MDNTHYMYKPGIQGYNVRYNDIIMSVMASPITRVSFDQLLVQGQIKENIKAPRHWTSLHKKRQATSRYLNVCWMLTKFCDITRRH